MQQLFTRSSGWDESVSECYKEQLANQLTDPKGFLSVDANVFVKKGYNSAGVERWKTRQA